MTEIICEAVHCPDNKNGVRKREVIMALDSGGRCKAWR